MAEGLRIPNDWEEEDGYITVLFCMPNSPSWRRIVAGHIEALSYGRAWNGETGTITDTQDIAGRMFETMQICDLETPLNRIADALDGGAEQRYTIGDIVTALEEIDTGLDIVDFLDFFEFLSVLLSKFPSLNFTISIPELLKMLTDFRYRASSLNYLEDIALSQRGSMIAQGGLPIQGIYENVGDTFNAAAAGLTGGQSAGIQWLFQVIKGKDIQIGQDLLDALNAVLFGSMRDAQYEIAEDVTSATSAIEDLATQLGLDLSDLSEAMTVTVNNDVTCGSCGKSSCDCNPEVDGPVEAEDEIEIDPCCVPSGFETMAEYEDHVCRFANYVADKLVISARQFQISYYRFLYDYTALSSQQRLSVTEIYKKVAIALPEMVDPILLATITNSERAELITLITSHYVSFQDGVILEVPETATLEDKITEFYDEPFTGPIDYLLDNLDDIKQEFYDAETTGDFIASMLSTISDAAAEALGDYSNLIGDLLSYTANAALGNSKYVAGQFDGYEPVYECEGNLCNCPAFHLVEAVHNGGSNFGSVEPNPDDHRISIRFNATSEAPPVGWCGDEVTITVSNVQGYSAAGGPNNDFIVLNQDLQTVYESNVPPSGVQGAIVIFTSSTAFSCDIDAEMNC